MPNLAERFAESKGRPLEVDGVLVHAIYRRVVTPGELVRIRRVHAVSSPTQGLRLSLKKGLAEIDGQKLKDVVFWADTAPSHVEVVCHTGKASSAELCVWNCWKKDDGVMHAWLCDAGMVIEEEGPRVSIHCGDGTHPFAPRDLEIELMFEVPSTS